MCDSEIERVVSIESNPDTFDFVPKDKDYQIRLNTWTGFVIKQIGYTLQKGKALPYSRDLKGIIKCFVFKFKFYK